MFCIDFSENSQKAFDNTLSLLKPQEDEAILVSVCEMLNQGFINSIRVGCDYQLLREANESLIEDTMRLLDVYKDRLTALGIKSKTIVKKGNPKELLCSIAEFEKVDTLVLGTRGLGQVKKMLMGSVSDYCLHNVSTPQVMIVK